ncbi:MAG: hypothetical protein Q8P89_00635, partial [bacterium]|nr:hypothetical protein [bacterium]
APVVPPAQVVAQSPAQGCPSSQEILLDNQVDNTVTGPAILHPWWNNGKPSFGQTQVRTQLGAGQTVTLLAAKGKAYVYQSTSACVANLDKEFGNASFTAKTVDDLKKEGLAR